MSTRAKSEEKKKCTAVRVKEALDEEPVVPEPRLGRKGNRVAISEEEAKLDEKRRSELKASGQHFVMPDEEAKGYVLNLGLLPLKYHNTEWAVPFFTKLAERGVIGVACRYAKVSRRMIAYHRDKDPDFNEIFEEALEHANDNLVEACRSRAVEGWIEPEFFKGKMLKDEQGNPVGKRKFDSTMGIFLMKRHDAMMGRGMTISRHEHTGAGGGPIQHNTTGLQGEKLDSALEDVVARAVRKALDKEYLSEEEVLDGVFEDVSVS